LYEKTVTTNYVDSADHHADGVVMLNGSG